MNPITNFEKWINSIATGTAPDIPPVTRFEHFLNKIRMAIARKSDITSGLPEYTNEDKGKVLTVANKMEQFTLIDEQSVYFDTEGVAHLAENSYRLPAGVDVIGMAGHVTIAVEDLATMTFDGVFKEESGALLFVDQTVSEFSLHLGAMFTGEHAGIVASDITSINVTISAYMDLESDVVSPAWTPIAGIEMIKAEVSNINEGEITFTSPDDVADSVVNALAKEKLPVVVAGPADKSWTVFLYVDSRDAYSITLRSQSGAETANISLIEESSSVDPKPLPGEIVTPGSEYSETP